MFGVWKYTSGHKIISQFYEDNVMRLFSYYYYRRTRVYNSRMFTIRLHVEFKDDLTIHNLVNNQNR